MTNDEKLDRVLDLIGALAQRVQTVAARMSEIEDKAADDWRHESALAPGELPAAWLN